MSRTEQSNPLIEVLIDESAFHNELVELVHLINAAHHLHRVRKAEDRVREGDSYNQEDHHYLFTLPELIEAVAQIRFSENPEGIKRGMGYKNAQSAATKLIEIGLLIRHSKPAKNGQIEMYYEYVQSPLTPAAPKA